MEWKRAIKTNFYQILILIEKSGKNTTGQCNVLTLIDNDSNFVTCQVAWHANGKIQTTLDRLTAGCHARGNQVSIYNVI